MRHAVTLLACLLAHSGLVGGFRPAVPFRSGGVARGDPAGGRSRVAASAQGDEGDRASDVADAARHALDSMERDSLWLPSGSESVRQRRVERISSAPRDQAIVAGDVSRFEGGFYDVEGARICRVVNVMGDVQDAELYGAAPAADDMLRDMHLLMEAGFSTWELQVASGAEAVFDGYAETKRELAMGREPSAEPLGRQESRALHADRKSADDCRLWNAYCSETAFEERRHASAVHRWSPCAGRWDRRSVLSVIDGAQRSIGAERIAMLTLDWRDFSCEYLEDVLLCLDDLRREGRIGALGVSDFPRRRLEDARRAGIALRHQERSMSPFKRHRSLSFVKESSGEGAAQTIVGRDESAGGLLSAAMLQAASARRFRPVERGEVPGFVRKALLCDPPRARRFLRDADEKVLRRWRRGLEAMALIARKRHCEVDAVAVAFALRAEGQRPSMLRRTAAVGAERPSPGNQGDLRLVTGTWGRAPTARAARSRAWLPCNREGDSVGLQLALDEEDAALLAEAFAEERESLEDLERRCEANEELARQLEQDVEDRDALQSAVELFDPDDFDPALLEEMQRQAQQDAFDGALLL